MCHRSVSFGAESFYIESFLLLYFVVWNHVIWEFLQLLIVFELMAVVHILLAKVVAVVHMDLHRCWKHNLNNKIILIEIVFIYFSIEKKTRAEIVTVTNSSYLNRVNVDYVPQKMIVFAF